MPLFATIIYAYMMMAAYRIIPVCHSFVSDAYHMHNNILSSVGERRRPWPRQLFRELISDDQEDLRTDISTIIKQDGLDEFLKVDDRLCVIKFYAPYCKACKAFGVKFRKLAIDRGDRLNAMGQVVLVGDSRFGEIEMSSNVILCKKLQIKKFPTVLIYKGGERLSEVLCKQAAIDDINKEMDQLLGNVW